MQICCRAPLMVEPPELWNCKVKHQRPVGYAAQTRGFRGALLKLQPETLDYSLTLQPHEFYTLTSGNVDHLRGRGAGVASGPSFGLAQRLSGTAPDSVRELLIAELVVQVRDRLPKPVRADGIVFGAPGKRDLKMPGEIDRGIAHPASAGCFGQWRPEYGPRRE